MKKFLGAAFALALAGTAPDACADDAVLKAHHFPAPQSPPPWTLPRVRI
ncbi:MAG: hypothetical protein FD176_2884 [Rhodospirillaceae bacterium]|nr:MAG: hypothetical protein FD176_2884 [Rhodospirillaceae bacterium]TNC95341.1 MAG: hypothetical protein FD119_2465 [Stygiobacter sp.]